MRNVLIGALVAFGAVAGFAFAQTVVATGGSLVDSKPGAGPGDFSGTAIRGGVERVIKTGDLVYIPPGVPHGIKESKGGVTYLNIRFEARAL